MKRGQRPSAEQVVPDRDLRELLLRPWGGPDRPRGRGGRRSYQVSGERFRLTRRRG
jgi:hypothetical protein